MNKMRVWRSSCVVLARCRARNIPPSISVGTRKETLLTHWLCLDSTWGEGFLARWSTCDTVAKLGNFSVDAFIQTARQEYNC